MQHDETYERERKNLIEEEEEGAMSENETEEEAFKDADEDDKDDVSLADDTQDE